MVKADKSRTPLLCWRLFVCGNKQGTCKTGYTDPLTRGRDVVVGMC